MKAALPDRIPAAVLFREIRERGYEGGIGPSLTEEPPKAVGQIQDAGRVSFPLPMTPPRISANVFCETQ